MSEICEENLVPSSLVSARNSRTNELQFTVAMLNIFLSLRTPEDSVRKNIIYNELTQCLSTPLKNDVHISRRLVQMSQEERLNLREKNIEQVLTYIEKVITNIIRILRESDQEDVILAVLGFLMVLFQSESALKRIFEDEKSGKSLCSALRVVFNSSSVIRKKQGIKVMLTILRTHENGCKNFEDSMKRRIPNIILFSDLDHSLSRSLNTDDSEIFNDLIEFYIFLINIEEISKERIIYLMEHSLRVTVLTILNNGLNRNVYFKFLHICCNNLRCVPYSVQFRIYTLFETVFGNVSENEVTSELIAYFSKLMNYWRDLKMKDSVEKIYHQLMTRVHFNVLIMFLKNDILRPTLAPVMIADVSFLRFIGSALQLNSMRLPEKSCFLAYEILGEVLEIFHKNPTIYKVGEMIVWKLSFVVQIMENSKAMISMGLLKFLNLLLKRNFNSPLVHICESEQKSGTVEKALNMIEFCLQNIFFRMKVTPELDEMIWVILAEILKYTMDPPKKMVYCNDDVYLVSISSETKKSLFKISTRVFLRSVMTQNPCSTLMSKKCLEYLDQWTNEAGKALKQPEESFSLSLMKRKDLFRLLNGIERWLSDGMIWREDATLNEKLRNEFVGKIVFRVDQIATNGYIIELEQEKVKVEKMCIDTE